MIQVFQLVEPSLPGLVFPISVTATDAGNGSAAHVPLLLLESYAVVPYQPANLVARVALHLALFCGSDAREARLVSSSLVEGIAPVIAALLAQSGRVDAYAKPPSTKRIVKEVRHPSSKMDGDRHRVTPVLESL